MIVICRVRHFVRCFIFERTSNARVINPWAGAVPLFVPMRGIVLTYGRLLPLGEDGHHTIKLVGDDLDSFATALGDRLCSEYLQQLQEMDSVEAFLRTFPLDDSTTNPSRLLVHGTANCLVDKVELGRSLLERASHAPVLGPAAAQIMQLNAVAAAYLSDLEQGRSVFLRAIEDCERDNLTAHFPGCDLDSHFSSTSSNWHVR
jgi:hypothetical protein